MEFFVIGVLFVAAVLVMATPAVLIVHDLWRQRVRSGS